MKQFLFSLVRRSCLPWFFREFIHQKQTTILCFHSPTPEMAEKHYVALKSAYNIITLDDFIRYNAGEISALPSKSLVITLDDGFKENFLLLSALEKHKIPITIFACSGIVGTHRHYWWRHAVQHRSVTELELMPNDTRLSLLSEAGFSETKENSDRVALSISEINKLTKFVNFQSHSKFHSALTQCDDERSLMEIHESKQELEDKLGSPINAIAFPNGKYGDREVQFCQQSGYKCALTTNEGTNDLHSDPYRLNRIDISDDANVDELLVKASGVWKMLKTILRK